MSVQTVDVLTPYSTVAPLIGAPPTWINAYDAQRIASYQVYDQMYRNVPNTYKLVARGTENNPIYIPSARVIIDTVNRYAGKGLRTVADPEQPDLGTPEQQNAARAALAGLFRREKFKSLFISQKRFGLIRGDWVFHVLANPAKLPGTRISILPVDPAAYKSITDPDDPDREIAKIIMEQIKVGDKDYIKRQMYTRGLDPYANARARQLDPTTEDPTIYNSVAVFDVKDWENLKAAPYQVLRPPTALPPQITSMPLYHIKNSWTPGDPYGTSTLSGLERIMAAVNQGISDEELALALEGLGVYATDAGPPKDAQTGQPTNWRLGPGRVVEIPPNTSFERVTGISAVTPYQDYLNWVVDWLWRGSALSDVAVGKVDVQLAESGIALALHLAPTMAMAIERNDEMADVLNQMFYDLLNGFFPAYEAQNYSGLSIVAAFNDPMPVNRAAAIKEILDIAGITPPVVSDIWVRDQLAHWGYAFDPQEGNNIAVQQQAMALAGDPFAARASGEQQVSDSGTGTDTEVV